MSGFLLGVPGRLKALLDRLTADRASRLDEITSTRMARLDADIGGGAVKSVQKGAVWAENSGTGTDADTRFLNITISSVDAAKSVVFFDGLGGVASSPLTNAISAAASHASSNGRIVRPRLTSNTNLRLSLHAHSGSMLTIFIGNWTVIEYE